MPAESPRAQAVQLGDLNLHYTEWGEPTAPPMVLLHGFMAHARTWDLFARDLASDYRILALDQRGHGDTGAAPGDSYTTDDYVGDLERFAAALGLTRFVLVGMSMGGRNAIVYTARHPEAVAKLVIVDIGPQAPAPAAPRPDAPQDPGIFDNPSQVADFLRGQDPYPPEDYRQEVARHSVRQRPDGRYEWKWAPRRLGHLGGVALDPLPRAGGARRGEPRAVAGRGRAHGAGAAERAARGGAAVGPSGAGGQRARAHRGRAGVPGGVTYPRPCDAEHGKRRWGRG